MQFLSHYIRPEALSKGSSNKHQPEECSNHTGGLTSLLAKRQSSFFARYLMLRRTSFCQPLQESYQGYDSYLKEKMPLQNPSGSEFVPRYTAQAHRICPSTSSQPDVVVEAAVQLEEAKINQSGVKLKCFITKQNVKIYKLIFCTS